MAKVREDMGIPLTANDSKSQLAAKSSQYETTARPPSKAAGFLAPILYGVVDVALVLPSQIGYASVVFSHPRLTNYIPYLIKLFFMSTACHQLVHSVMDTLKFSGAGSQDAVLIVMSALATSLVSGVAENEVESVLPTCFISFALGSLCIGILMFFASMFPRVVRVVQYIPLPVVGGFLAGVGLFLLRGGLTLVTDLSINDLPDYALFFDASLLKFMAPTIVLGWLIFYAKRRTQHFLVIPVSALLSITLFYIILAACGSSLDDAKAGGWVYADLAPPSPFYQAWKYFDFGAMQWGMLTSNVDQLLKMVFIYPIAALLCSSAVETSLGLEFDYQKELKLAGVSNIVTGLVGGMPGSRYVVVSIMNGKALSKLNTRLAGLTSAALHIILVLVDVPILSVVPKFFFGAILVSIGIELCSEWLVDARKRMTTLDLLISYVCVACIFTLGLLQGLGITFALSAISFDVQYSRTAILRPVPLRPSSTMRVGEVRKQLKKLRRKIVMFSCQGYLFFGTGRQLQDQVAATVQQNLLADPAEKLEYFILDCHLLRGLDSSAGNVLDKVKRTLESHGISLVFAHLSREIKRFLEKEGLLYRPPNATDDDCDLEQAKLNDAHTFSCIAVPDVDSALEWCENALLAHQPLHSQIIGNATVANVTAELPTFTEFASELMVESTQSNLEAIATYFERLRLTKGAILFQSGQQSSAVFVVESGTVLCSIPLPAGGHKKLSTVTANGLIGQTDYVLGETHSFETKVVSATAQVLRIDDTKMKQMQNERLDLFCAWQQLLLKDFAYNVRDGYFERLRADSEEDVRKS